MRDLLQVVFKIEPLEAHQARVSEASGAAATAASSAASAGTAALYVLSCKGIGYTNLSKKMQWKAPTLSFSHKILVALLDLSSEAAGLFPFQVKFLCPVSFNLEKHCFFTTSGLDSFLVILTKPLYNNFCHFSRSLDMLFQGKNGACCGTYSRTVWRKHPSRKCQCTGQVYCRSFTLIIEDVGTWLR